MLVSFTTLLQASGSKATNKSTTPGGIRNPLAPAVLALPEYSVSQLTVGWFHPGRQQGIEDHKGAGTDPKRPPSVLQIPPPVSGYTIRSFAKA